MQTDSWIVPASAASKNNPGPADAQSITRGQQLYNMVCMACHGTKGNGDGPAAAALGKHPGVLSNPLMWEQPDGVLFWKITEGRTPMPPFGQAFDPAQRWDLINYIRTFAPKPANYVAPSVRAVAPAPVTAPVSSTPGHQMQTGGPAQTGDFVTRKEYESLQQQLSSLQAQLEALAGHAIAVAPDAPTQAADTSPAGVETSVADLASDVQGLKHTVADLKPGTTHNLVTGYAFAGYNRQIDGNATFTAGLNSIFLWQTSDRLLFESELELELEDGETAVGLEYAHLTYLLNDYVTIGAGKFLTPFGIFRERLHPAWINKLPDAPPAFGHHGLIPPSTLGVQIRGGLNAGGIKWNYTLFAGNGPRLNTGMMEPEEAGMLHFNNDDDFSGSKMAGARVGFMPIPELELGYSGLIARMSDLEGTSKPNANAQLHGVYLSYVRDSDVLRGLLDIKSEWMWSQVDRLTYDPMGMIGFGPLRFDNSRNGGYAQIAYRPTQATDMTMRNFEGIFRYDRLNLPAGALENAESWRSTFGLNYWINSQTVVKAAYEFGSIRESGEETEHHDTFLLQAAMGF